MVVLGPKKKDGGDRARPNILAQLRARCAERIDAATGGDRRMNAPRATTNLSSLRPLTSLLEGHRRRRLRASPGTRINDASGSSLGTLAVRDHCEPADRRTEVSIDRSFLALPSGLNHDMVSRDEPRRRDDRDGRNAEPRSSAPTASSTEKCRHVPSQTRLTHSEHERAPKAPPLWPTNSSAVSTNDEPRPRGSSTRVGRWVPGRVSRSVRMIK